MITMTREGEEVLSEQFQTIGGRLHLEFIPSDELTQVSGPDIYDPQTGAYRVSGDFLADIATYSIQAEILRVANTPPDEAIVDEFRVEMVPEFPVGALVAAFAIGGAVAFGRFGARFFGNA
jgi:hypothetical protein